MNANLQKETWGSKDWMAYSELTKASTETSLFGPPAPSAWPSVIAAKIGSFESCDRSARARIPVAW
jgi:hypothetical protein